MPLITLIVYAVLGVFLLALVASFLVPAVRFKGGRRLVALATVAAFWLGIYWWNSGQPERLALEKSPHYEYFEAVCRNAGVKVFHTVPDVDSVAFQAPRSAPTPRDLQDRAFVGDVYGALDLASESAERALVTTFLTKKEWEQRWYVPTQAEFLRYPQVEVAGSYEGRAGFVRYVDASVGSRQDFSRSFVDSPASRYFVKWEDISTPADREHWIAGSRWTIVDSASNKVLGERIAYAIDLDQGRTAWGPTGDAGEPALPWLRAGHVQYRRNNVENSCPPKQSPLYNLEFVRSVLQPTAQEMKVIPIPKR